MFLSSSLFALTDFGQAASFMVIACFILYNNVNVSVSISVINGGVCWTGRLNVWGNRKEGDLMQLYKDCIHVVCKDISFIHLVNKLMKQTQ